MVYFKKNLKFLYKKIFLGEHAPKPALKYSWTPLPNPGYAPA